MIDEFTDIGYPRRGVDRLGLRRLLDHITTHEIGHCVVGRLDRPSCDPEDYADIDEALTDARW